jgi:D-alanyl-lipoteichoic acid acyltransferase DltB (MBOAT superfamily)
MPFDEFSFLFFFLPVLLAAWLILARFHAERHKWLVGSFLGGISALYYWFGSPEFFPLLLALTLFNFAVGWGLMRSPRSPLYWLGMAVDLGVLGWFKYDNFVIQTLNSAFGQALPQIATVLPLGISFFTFQKIAYLTDIRRGERESWQLGEFFLLVWFFPQLIAGPIVRPHEFIPQWRNLRLDGRRVAVNLCVGLTLFFVGLIKKLALADTVAPYADLVFGQAAAGVAPRLSDAWIGVLAFSARIYFDFSAYSDMAIGLARILGFRLPINFDSPYQATSIIEFWRRWHMTLSRFLRDYLYIPLGGNRRGRVRRYGNLMTVMLIGGLWHGAAWHFVFWGGLHGLYLSVNHLWREASWRPLPPALGWAVTLAAVIFAWVAFRSPSLVAALSIWSGMVGLNGVVVPHWAPFADELVRLMPNYIEVRSLLHPFVNLEGGPAPLLAIPIGLASAVLLPNVYQWLDRFQPAMYYRPKPISERSALSWRPSIPAALALASATAVAVIYAGRPLTYLYWQF